MSVTQMAMVWELDLPPNVKYVLLAYADHADHDGGSVRPSLDRVAHKTGYSKRQIIRTAKALVKANLMFRVRESTPTEPPEYQLTLYRGDKLTPLKPNGGVTYAYPPEGIEMSPKPSGKLLPPTEGEDTPPKSKMDQLDQDQLMSNPFGFYAALLKAYGAEPTDKDRARLSRNLKTLITTHSASLEEMRRIVSKAVEAHMGGYDFYPKDALQKIRARNGGGGAGNVVQLQSATGSVQDTPRYWIDDKGRRREGGKLWLGPDELWPGPRPGPRPEGGVQE